ncbi:hypothetical protein PAPYR_12673 [Paratrimastix pyriformis]|uniref:Mannosyltransferase n=1 Tax=Paratrimastix pyriformis TaxID=342808 RepID=A0ABQ8U6N6_9EUKA|nr:hypothetical protein PAPYR_12673 [Paratrimastix pyriformis]
MAYMLCRHWCRSPRGTLLTLSTAWVMLLMHMRPFSNTVESLLLALMLFVYFMRKSGSARSIGLGVVTAVAFFCRFTFAVFAMPVILFAGMEALAQGYLSSTQPDTPSSQRRMRGLKALVWCWGQALLAFLSVAVVIIVVDSAYFHTTEFRLDGHVLRGFREFNRVMQAPDLWPRLQHTTRCHLHATLFVMKDFGPHLVLDPVPTMPTPGEPSQSGIRHRVAEAAREARLALARFWSNGTVFRPRGPPSLRSKEIKAWIAFPPDQLSGSCSSSPGQHVFISLPAVVLGTPVGVN